MVRRESRHRKTALRKSEQHHKARGQALMAQYNPAADGCARAERSPSRRPSSFASFWMRLHQ